MARLHSSLRLLKFSLARMVLENANLTNQARALRTVVAHYQALKREKAYFVLLKIFIWYSRNLKGVNRPRPDGPDAVAAGPVAATATRTRG